MPSVDVLISSPVVETFRVSQVRGMFDLPPDSAVSQSWRFDFPIETEPWQIGLIVGPSSSGKSVVARHVFKSAYFHTGYKWPRNKSVVDGFPSHLSGEDVTAALPARRGTVGRTATTVRRQMGERPEPLLRPPYRQGVSIFFCRRTERRNP